MREEYRKHDIFFSQKGERKKEESIGRAQQSSQLIRIEEGKKMKLSHNWNNPSRQNSTASQPPSQIYQ